MNVSVEGNQNTLTPVRRGSERRGGGLVILIQAAGAHVFAEHAVQNYRCECVHLSARPAGCVVGSEALLVVVRTVPKRSGFL